MIRFVPPCIRTVGALFLAGVLLAAGACGDGGGGGGDDGGRYGAPQGTTPGSATTGTSSAMPTAESPGAAAAVPTPVTVQGTEINYHGQRSVVGESSVSMELDDNYFEPSVLIGSPGQELTLNLHNEGDIEHTFTIESQGIDTELGPGEEDQVTVTFPQSKRTDFICTYHISGGMGGVLAVTDEP